MRGTNDAQGAPPASGTGSHTAKTRVGRGEGPRARRPVAAPRAPRRGTRCRPASRVVRCRCTCGCPSSRASEPVPGRYQVVNVERLAACSPTAGRSARRSWSRPGRSGQPAGQGPRRRGTRRRLGDVPAHKFSARRGRRSPRPGADHHGLTSDPGRLIAAFSRRFVRPQGARARRDARHRLTHGDPQGGHVLRRSPRRSGRLICEKILFSLAISRLPPGRHHPAPGVSVTAINTCLEQAQAGDQRTSTRWSTCSPAARCSGCRVFALGIMPYITASIIVQLLVVVIPRFEQLKKEGQAGQQKLTQYTRYLTIGLAILQSTASSRWPGAGSCSRAAPSRSSRTTSFTPGHPGHHADRRHRA